MKIGITVIICTFLYTLLVAIVYFSKKRIDTTENKIYNFLLKITLIGLLLELMCCYTVYSMNFSIFHTVLNEVVNRTYVIYLLTWELTFTIYMFFISFNNKKDLHNEVLSKKNKIIVLVVYVLMLLCALFLPLYYYNDGNFIYSYGPATNMLYVVGMLCIICDNVCIFANLKNIKNKKYYPLFILVLLMIVVIIIRNLNPGLIVINSAFAFVTAIMYFTIENPDLQMIGELYRNKELVEQSYEDKSNFLFELTQQVRNPIMNITKECKSLENINDIEEIKQGIKSLNNHIRQLDFVVNDVLDVSTLEAQKIKIVENRYNVNTLYNEIVSKMQSLIPNNVEFITTTAKRVPYLYGDSIKLKQIIYSLLLNSVKKTEAGFIEFHIDTIERYDVCRLLFSIKDSGCGISLDKINEILAVTGEINQDDIKAMEKSEINIQLCQKIIKLFGGNLMIKSDVGKGTEIILSIDQRVVLDNKENILDKYEFSIKANKQVLLVAQDKELSKNIKKKLHDEVINVSHILYGKDATDKIKSGKKYDYIIIEDDMQQMNGYTTLKELKEIDKFNIPTIIMLKENKENIKEHYINDGFADYILVSDLNKEIDKIIQKY